MSASLVGSEMCIRDSSSPAPAEPPGPELPPSPSAPRRGPRKMAWGREPVSYTHLTLPTICSV
eukprot:7661588-Alexandrium_andersonii.AAC.1